MFPPSIEEAKFIGLDKTMRLMPHDQNTGGFFVALLKKHNDFEWKYANQQGDKIKEGEDVEGREEEFLKSNLPEVEEAVAKEDQFNPDKPEHHDSDEEG